MALSNTKFGGTKQFHEENRMRLLKELKLAKLIPKNTFMKKLKETKDIYEIEEMLQNLRRCQKCSGLKSFNYQTDKFECRRCDGK